MTYEDQITEYQKSMSQFATVDDCCEYNAACRDIAKHFGKVADVEIANLKRLLQRYLDETPLGHQPHMIASEARDALAG